MASDEEAGGPPVVAATMGDPAGIGAEVIVKAVPVEGARTLVVGDADVVAAALTRCGLDRSVRVVTDVGDARFDADTIDVLDLDNVDGVEYGTVDAAYGRASLDYVERAIALAREGRVDAIATAPIHKRATQLAGSDHAGHTGLLADATETTEYAMLLVEGDLRVSHVSTHVSLRDAIERVTTGNVLSTVRVTHEALGHLGVEEPTVAVAGLNPHAGDDGLFGAEDGEEIRPAVERAREAGIDAVGPAPPDTVFARAATGDADAVVAMYHDQGHIPVKMLGFARGDAITGVNVTIGLPIVRTSVDHGTAFDIAGKGVADATSMRQAIELAARIARNRFG